MSAANQPPVSRIKGDPNQHTFSITKITFERLMAEERGIELLALYSFYCYCSKWQATNKVWATDSFAAEKLKRSREYVGKLRRELEVLGMVGSIQENLDGGHFGKRYIQVFYLIPAGEIVDHSGRCDRQPDAVNPPTNALELYKGNALELCRDQVPEKTKPSSIETMSGDQRIKQESLLDAPATRKRFEPPTAQLVKSLFETLGMNGNSASQAEAFIDHHAARGWILSGKTKMRDWHAAARTWARNSVKFAPLEQKTLAKTAEDRQLAAAALRDATEAALEKQVQEQSLRELRELTAKQRAEEAAR